VILVVSHPGDDHAIGVLGALERAGHPAVLVDTALFPSAATVTQRFGAGPPRWEIAFGAQRVDLAECRAAWWRRPQALTLHPGLDAGVVAWTYTECNEALAGMWAALDVTWVNSPNLDEAAHHKPYQLSIAAEVGLPIPKTVITNDPAVARAFADEVGLERTVYKTFLASEEHWRETRILKREELGLLDRVALAPVIFQEYVAAEADLRVTVVGERMFAAAIRPAPGAYAVDYRMDIQGASFVATELDAGTQQRLRALMERLGLVYGAIDLRRTVDGDVFLEVNPAGEWRFVEDRTGQPITAAMADLLTSLDRA
jgi:glutathione synthase/RimK-type ligase-like ATP-grasp enzyme